jgi:hypothetical protein
MIVLRLVLPRRRPLAPAAGLGIVSATSLRRLLEDRQ